MSESKHKKLANLNFNAPSEKEKHEKEIGMYFYYLPCLNPKIDVFGAITGLNQKVEVGDIFLRWDFPVEVIEVPNCELKTEVDYKAVPLLKVKAINMNKRTKPARIFVD